MITILITYIVNFIFMAILIGVFSFCIFNKKGTLHGFWIWWIILVLCGLMDMLWYPAICQLGATIQIQNQQMAKLLELGVSFPATEIFKFNLLDLPVWLAQSLIAFFVGRALCRAR